MPKVYNWQIGREMEYPYDVPRPKKQFAAIFDTNKCIACQTCTITCKMTWTQGRGQEYMFWNNVESKPFGSYPFEWDFKVLQMIEGGKWEGEKYVGKTIFEKAQEEGKTVKGFLPSVDDFAYPNLGEDEIWGGEVEGGMHVDSHPHPIWFFYLPRICNHCTYPGCGAACPRQSIYKRRDNGVVLIDQERCQGYRRCVEGCPFKKSMYNATTGRSEKCVACYPKMEEGIQTQCVEQCIGKIRMQGWVNQPDDIDEYNPIDYLVHVRKIALPLYPQFGTEGNVYYIPPIHVPTPFLKQMFGPRVEHAVEVYRDALKSDPVLQGLLVLFGSAPEIMTRFQVKNGVAYGYDERGRKVAEAPITEPLQFRDHYDAQRDVYRLDVT